jgi:6-phosphogluconolactonase (cycloisomerase 2 family)
MLTPRRLSAVAASTAALSLSLAAGSAAASAPSNGHDQVGTNGAVFVQTDNTAGNAIAVYDRGRDGSLSPAGTYSTGGNGGVLGGSQVDHLASQDSLVYDAGAGELFAVNAGSDTVTVFGVRGDRLHRRQITASGGTFPVSIAVHGDLVYVLNALNGGTIQGYRLLDGFLSPVPGSSRSLGLDPTATPQFTTTPGDIAFTPDGRDLLVTTKANTNAIDVFAVDAQGQPAATPVINSEPGTVPFSLAFEGGHQVDVGEAGPNAVASFSLLGDGTLRPLASLGTGGSATCWLVADGNVLFAGNAGSATESSVLDAPSGGLTLTATTTTDPGTVDAASSPGGRYLYVQTGANGIVDEFQVGPAGALTALGSVTVPNAIGGEGIATS